MALKYLGLAVSLKLRNLTKSSGASVKYQYSSEFVSNEAEEYNNISRARWRCGLPVLDLLLGAIFKSIFYLAWGLAVTHFSFVLLAST
jgi:hypothetical protein